MNKFVFVALMTWTGLMAAASLAPGNAAAPHGATRRAERAALAEWAPTGTWTCAHNAYRSVFCP
jgi:hypothetical protein